MDWVERHNAWLGCRCEHDLDELDCSSGRCGLDERCAYLHLHRSA